MSRTARFTALFLILFLSSCTDPEPLRVGFVGGLSGRIADLGIAGRNGLILATEEINRGGGINGQRIEILIQDDQQDAEKAREAVKKLIDNEVLAIIGHMTSSMAIATIELANKARVVMLSPTATSTRLSNLDDYFLRVISSTNVYARKSAEYLISQGYFSASAFYDRQNLAYTESWLKNFTEHYEKLGGRIISKYDFNSGTNMHFSSLATKILQDKPEAIVSISNAMDTAMFSQQLRKSGSDLPLATCEWAATERLIDLGGQSVEGAVVDQFFDRESRIPSYEAFRTAYKIRFASEPGFASVASYDAAMTLFAALRQSTNRDDIKQTILSMGEINGVQGPFRMNRFGDASRPSFLAKIKDGKFKRIH